MHIGLVTPAPAGTRYGNRVTALRWARILRELGHRVIVEREYDDGSRDLLIALHARRSFQSIQRFRERYPERPLVVGLTGTDLYRDIRNSREAQSSLELATRLVVLQPLGIAELPEPYRPKARVIFQSARPIPGENRPAKRTFDVAVIGHLRPEKDPFRAALASRRLLPSSRIRVVQVGGAMSGEMEARAQAEETVNPRYRWLGELPRWRARRILARSRVLILSSKLEGGANVLSEALADMVPILASRIPGSVGILGEDYPGFFPVGDTRRLAGLLTQVESDDAEFLAQLRASCARLAPLVRPARERESWRKLLTELVVRR